MTNEQIQALKASALAATTGDWTPDTNFGFSIQCDRPGLDRLLLTVNGPNSENDLRFISQAQPDVILSLLADREADKALIAEQAKRIAELQSDNAYIRNRHKELDLLIGKNILVMQAAIIEWHGTGDAKNGLAWIYNTLFGPGELPDEAEKDAQAYFDRKYAPLDEEIMALHQWFWAQSEAERAAAGITLVVGGEDATN